MYHNTVRQEFVEKIPANCKTKHLLNINFVCVETSNTLTKDMAESSINLTMTESGQNHLRTEATNNQIKLYKLR